MCVLLAVFLIHNAFLPFALPVFLRKKHASMQTKFYEDICVQSTQYTCGPASAATALKQFGIEAVEGEIAILAYTTPVLGTADNLLCRAIEKKYKSEGISCIYRPFDSIAQLKGICPVIAVIKFSFFCDHYVTVLEVSDDYVLIGDSLKGKEKLTYEEFKKKWRFTGIVVTRKMD